MLISMQLYAVTDTLKTSGKVAYWNNNGNTAGNYEGVRGFNAALGQKGYVYSITTESDTLKNAASVLVTQPFGQRTATDAQRRNLCSNTKFMVGINVNIAFTGGAATLVVQGSGDGTNWVTVATASSNLSSVITGPGTTWYLVDLTSIFLPYYRLVFNAGGATVNRVGRLQMMYCLPQ